MAHRILGLDIGRRALKLRRGGRLLGLGALCLLGRFSCRRCLLLDLRDLLCGRCFGGRGFVE